MAFMLFFSVRDEILSVLSMHLSNSTTRPIVTIRRLDEDLIATVVDSLHYCSGAINL